MLTLKEYYDQKSVLNEIFNNLENPGWRRFVIEDTNGSFRNNDKRINTINKLREFLGNQPSKVYVSVAQFLNPLRLYGKTTKKTQFVIADSLFLKSDLLFDLDGDGIDFKTPHNDGKKIIEHMKSESYELINIRFSGKKGWHLLYRDNEPIIEKDPIKRYQRTEEKRKELIERLPKLKTIDEHHKRIVADQFRVHAVIGTVKAETGYKVTKIDKKDFMILSTERLCEISCQRVVRAVSPMIRMTSQHKQIEQERATLSSCSPYTYSFIDNVVKGINTKIIDGKVDYRYVTVLKYPRNMDKMIIKTQKTYNLSDFYKFLYNNTYIYINFKLVDRRRLEKIMKFSKPMNLNSFMFYHHSWFPISETKDINGNIICEKPILKDVLKSEYSLDDTHSRPHANLLKLKYKNMAGKEMNNICKAFVGEKW